MEFRTWQSQVVARLDALLDREAGHRGGKKAILDSIGLGSRFFGELRARAQTDNQRIPLDKVFLVIEALGTHPAVLLYQAASDLEPGLPTLEPSSSASGLGTEEDLAEQDLAEELSAEFDRLTLEEEFAHD